MYEQTVDSKFHGCKVIYSYNSHNGRTKKEQIEDLCESLGIEPVKTMGLTNRKATIKKIEYMLGEILSQDGFTTDDTYEVTMLPKHPVRLQITNTNNEKHNNSTISTLSITKDEDGAEKDTTISITQKSRENSLHISPHLLPAKEETYTYSYKIEGNSVKLKLLKFSHKIKHCTVTHSKDSLVISKTEGHIYTLTVKKEPTANEFKRQDIDDEVDKQIAEIIRKATYPEGFTKTIRNIEAVVKQTKYVEFTYEVTKASRSYGTIEPTATITIKDGNVINCRLTLTETTKVTLATDVNITNTECLEAIDSTVASLKNPNPGIPPIQRKFEDTPYSRTAPPLARAKMLPKGLRVTKDTRIP